MRYTLTHTHNTSLNHPKFLFIITAEAGSFFCSRPVIGINDGVLFSHKVRKSSDHKHSFRIIRKDGDRERERGGLKDNKNKEDENLQIWYSA